MMTQQSAMRILKNSKILELGVTPDVSVLKIYTVNPKTNEPFVWENSTNNYAIVEFKAMNVEGAKKSLEMFKAGDFENCCKNNLSARVSLKVANKLQHIMSASVELVQITGRDGKLADVIKTVIPSLTDATINELEISESSTQQTLDQNPTTKNLKNLEEYKIITFNDSNNFSSNKTEENRLQNNESNDKNSDSVFSGCLIVIFSMGVSIYFCIPIIKDLHFIAYPIVLIFGLLIAKVLEGIFLDN